MPEQGVKQLPKDLLVKEGHPISLLIAPQKSLLLVSLLRSMSCIQAHQLATYLLGTGHSIPFSLYFPTFVPFYTSHILPLPCLWFFPQPIPYQVLWNPQLLFLHILSCVPFPGRIPLPAVR